MQRNPNTVPSHAKNPDKTHRKWSGCWKDQSRRRYQHYRVKAAA